MALSRFMKGLLMSKMYLITVFVALFSMPAAAGFFDNIGNAVDTAVREEIKKSVDDALAPEAAKKKAPVKKANSLEATESDLWQEVRVQWGQNIRSEDVALVKHDVTCDGHKDYVVSRLNQNNPDGPFYNVLVVTKDGGKRTSEGFSLAFDGSQEGLCEPIASPDVSVEIEHWDEGKLDAEMGGWEGICTEAIRVDDGMCDAIRYFWLTGESDPEYSRFMTHRN